jgi:signal transduction histidine kinase
LIAILIVAAGVNLFLFYQDSNSQTTQSYSIINVANVKVLAEKISTSAILVANGDESSEKLLKKDIENVEGIFEIIKNGGMIDSQKLDKIPNAILKDFEKLTVSWNLYKETTDVLITKTVFDKDAKSAQEYVQEKNSELNLLALEMKEEFEGLGRDYNRHKQIAEDLVNYAQVISEQTHLLSNANDQGIQNELKNKNLQFEVGMRKLLQISTDGLNLQSINAKQEDLIPIPRENSNALRKIDPLWESMHSRITLLENRGLFSSEFNDARIDMENQKKQFYFNMDELIKNWTDKISNQGSNEQNIIQIILVVDIAVFFLVLFVVRQSLSPLASITQAISRVKEGNYGEKIEYSGTDEMGQLVNNFNIMSNTIKEKEEEAKKTDIAKDEFLAMITHELKTPLVPIQGYADILLSEHLGKINNKQKERIEIIKSSSETLLSIISDLLDAQKLELGQLRITKEKSNIKNTIEGAINTLQPEATQKNIEISSNIFDLTIEHDPDRINQVITNLIKNSMNAVKSNVGKINVSMEESPTDLKIIIKDNGIGIPIEKQNELFKKFYQVDATLTRESGGSGLGLAICKGIINNHMGEISVVSALNQGATFSFSIPKNPSEQGKSPLNSA